MPPRPRPACASSWALWRHDVCAAGHPLQLTQPWFVPASASTPLRRDALAGAGGCARRRLQRLPRATPVEPPAPYPEDTLSYLANVFNHKAHDFYARHGVKVIDAAYESHEEEGEVSLMITKHCVRYSMSLCPKQAKGVTGVQGHHQGRALQLINGKEKLTLRFDCKPCEMHVVGKMKKSCGSGRCGVSRCWYRASRLCGHLQQALLCVRR
jgi:hypothetical protein